MTVQTLFLELNEISFDFVCRYCDSGKLPNLHALIRAHGITNTTSESRYEDLEPWIQWVTAHTGLNLAEHGVFRLGDIVRHDLPQIWEMLEAEGLRVGAICPMNAKHRLRDPAFFVPDPWTQTKISGNPLLRELYRAVAQAVSDNAHGKVTPRTLLGLVAGMAHYARPAHYARYFSLALGSRRAPWRRAIFLDLLLADVFLAEVERAKPNFASLFLNAGAHIQHHYMFSSAAYRGDRSNPEWYATKAVDPVLEVYQCYDEIVGDVRRNFPNARLMLATGLKQEPHPELTYYWRLRDHAAFMRLLGVPFQAVQPLMSRDFVLTCRDRAEASSAAARLARVTSHDGVPLFEVNNRGMDLFVMLTYPHEVDERVEFMINGQSLGLLSKHVSLVALKNGQHHGTGSFLDTAVCAGEQASEIALRDLPTRIADSLGVRLRPVPPQQSLAAAS